MPSFVKFYSPFFSFLKKFILLIIAVFMMSGCQVNPISEGTEAPTCQYFLGTKSFFISIKDFRENAGLFVALRTWSLPVIGKMNYFLSALEYNTGHSLNDDDVSDIIGKDFTIQLLPRFIFISRTKKEYPAFFVLKIQNDPVIKYGNNIIRVKDLHQIGKKLYYIFINDLLFASDNLKALKHVINKRRVFGTAQSASYILYDSTGKSFLSSLFKARPVLLYGNELGKFSIRNENRPDASFFDPALAAGFNINLQFLREWFLPVYGKLLIRDIYANQDKVRMDYAFLIPLTAGKMAYKKISTAFLKKIDSGSAQTYETVSDKYFCISSFPYEPRLEDTGLVFYFDMKKMAVTGLLPPGASEFFSSQGSVGVRKEVQ